MPTSPDPVDDLDDLDDLDLDVEDAFGHRVSGTSGSPNGADGRGGATGVADGGALDDEGDVDDLDV